MHVHVYCNGSPRVCTQRLAAQGPRRRPQHPPPQPPAHLRPLPPQVLSLPHGSGSICYCAARLCQPLHFAIWSPVSVGSCRDVFHMHERNCLHHQDSV